MFEERKLRAVMCHDSDAGNWHTDAEEGLHKLDADGRLCGVDDAVTFCFFAREEAKGRC